MNFISIFPAIVKSRIEPLLLCKRLSSGQSRRIGGGVIGRVCKVSVIIVITTVFCQQKQP